MANLTVFLLTIISGARLQAIWTLAPTIVVEQSPLLDSNFESVRILATELQLT